MSSTTRTWNFSAGPAVLPEAVLQEAAKGLVSYGGTGHGIVELSHRDKPVLDMVASAERALRQLLSIPDDYAVLFLQGGASTQFSAVPLNLTSSLEPAPDPLPCYLTTGTWSQAAVKEARRYLPARSTTLDSAEAAAPCAYYYYCDNETVHGVELPGVPGVDADSVLVCDMSSNFLSRRVDVSKYGVIFAGAQKNSGIAGLTIVVVRRSLLGGAHPLTPEMLNWTTAAANGSMYNTPPVFAIYMSALVFDWTLAQGGVEEMERRSQAKSALLYDAIDASQLYVCPVAKPLRSRMNVVFRVVGSDGAPCPRREDQFAQEAAAAGLLSLKGHRSVGGLRASLYNAMPIEGVQALVTFMQDFERKINH